MTLSLIDVSTSFFARQHVICVARQLKNDLFATGFRLLEGLKVLACCLPCLP